MGAAVQTWKIEAQFLNRATMSDLFKRDDVLALLRGKTLLILGGSIQRGIYKDIIWLMNSNSLINSGVS